MKMNLRNMINKLLDWEWKKKEIPVNPVMSDFNDELSEWADIRVDLDTMKEETEKLQAANVLVKQQIGQRAKTGDSAAEEFQGYIDSLGNELHDLENELKTLRLRTSAIESTSESRNNEISGIRQEIVTLKTRKIPEPRKDPLPKKDEILVVKPPKLQLIEAVYEATSHAIRQQKGAVKATHVYTIVTTLGEYNELSVRPQISKILQSIAWNNKQFYNYQKTRGLFPQRHGIPLQLSAKQIRNGNTKYRASMRKKK